MSLYFRWVNAGTSGCFLLGHQCIFCRDCAAKSGSFLQRHHCISNHLVLLKLLFSYGHSAMFPAWKVPRLLFYRHRCISIGIVPQQVDDFIKTTLCFHFKARSICCIKIGPWKGDVFNWDCCVSSLESVMNFYPEITVSIHLVQLKELYFYQDISAFPARILPWNRISRTITKCVLYLNHSLITLLLKPKET